MLKKIYSDSLHYFSKHPMLNSIAHVAGGFGLALILVHYLPGNVALSPLAGWILVGFECHNSYHVFHEKINSTMADH